MTKKKYKPKKNRVLAKKDASDSFSLFLASGIDLEGRTVDLFDDVDNESVGMVIRGIQLMIKKSIDLPITINIMSFGGDPYAGFALYDFIRSLPCLVKTVNMGCCMSAGVLIFLAGDERYCYDNSVFMAHSVSSYAEGKVKLALRTETEECGRLHDQMCTVLSENTSKTRKQWDKLIEHKDVYYRAASALKIGIVHKIIKKKEDLV